MDCFVEHFFDETFCGAFISIILSVSTSGRDSTNKEPLHIYRERGRSWIRPSLPSALSVRNGHDEQRDGFRSPLFTAPHERR